MFSVALLGVIVLALGDDSPVIAPPTILTVLVIVALFHVAFAGHDLFSIIFANSVGVYACIYVVFIAGNFPQARATAMQIGFLLPLVSFAAGVLTHRRKIQHLLDRTKRHAAVPLRETIRWVGPLLIVAVVTTYLQVNNRAVNTQDAALTGSMAVIGMIAWVTSKSIALFLIECGVILRAFLRNAVKLTQPAFALLTCYFLITIIFGCIYTIYDRASASSHFLTNGAGRTLTFPDGLYLSISTLTTVGFGDIIAITPLARLIVSSEVLCGILLLLFGVEAMLDRTRPR